MLTIIKFASRLTMHKTYLLPFTTCASIGNSSGNHMVDEVVPWKMHGRSSDTGRLHGNRSSGILG